MKLRLRIARRHALLLGGFLALEIFLIVFIDRPLSEMMRMLDTQHHALIDFFRSWTDFGKSQWYLWPSGIGAIACAVIVRQKSANQPRREQAQKIGQRLLFLFLCGAAAGIITDIIKPILGRARPVEWSLEHVYGFYPFTFHARWNSMPSGHATSAVAFALVLAGYFPRLRIPFFTLAGCLALSRIMVNAHYLSDVVAGGVVAFLTVTALQRLRDRNGIFHMINVFFPLTARPPDV